MESYRLENLTFTYPERPAPALDGVSVAVERGAFVTLCGASGCGKTTLLRQLKPSLAPHGVKSGEIFFENQPLDGLSQREQSAKIGFVLQSPENQIVTDKVWHELAFGLESLGLSTPEIRLRVAEMASFFGIQTWFHKAVTELSGGQKQLLNLASIMAMQPSALILDEPTSQLDPIAASELLATVGKINRELGVTVILTEHRLEEAFPLSDKVIVMEGGRIIASGTPSEIGLVLRENSHKMFLAMPTVMRIWSAFSDDSPCPVTIRDGKNWLEKQMIKNSELTTENAKIGLNAAPVVELSDVWFKYDKNLPDVIKGLSYKAYAGQISAILGGNGTGKTTALSLAANLNKPYRGSVKIDSSFAVLPQNPQSLFVKKTVREDLLEILSEMKIPKAEKQSRLTQISALCRLDGLLDNHPYDLSGGEQQRAALAKALLLQPKILLLDEPTKGIDAEFKQILAGILRKLAAAGAAVVMVSHDVEFCAEFADRCALFFDGGIVSEGTPREFFSGNSFYTTSANRMARAVLPQAIVAQDIIAAFGGKTQFTVDNGQLTVGDGSYAIAEPEIAAPIKTIKLSEKRKIIAGLFALCLLATTVFAALNFGGLKAFISGGDLAVNLAANAAETRLYIEIMLALAASILGLTLSLTYKRGDAKYAAPPLVKRKLSRRTIAAALMILLLIPLTIFIGYYYLGDRKYYFVSLLIILETMLPFALVFESRKPQARELVIIAALCAIAVAGRAAFFMLPQFKPVVALVIIAGVAFGGEAGFLVGAMTGFVSNMFFGQGPWTPWQMFAFGLIGFLAGVLFRKGLLRRSTGALCAFGAFATLIIYGGLMNPAMVLMYQSSPTRAMLLAAYLQGLPFDLVHAAATMTFMLIISQPMLEKLDRIKVKYGLVE